MGLASQIKLFQLFQSEVAPRKDKFNRFESGSEESEEEVETDTEVEVTDSESEAAAAPGKTSPVSI